MAKRSEKMIPLDVLQRMTELYRQDLKTLNQEFDAVLKLEATGLQVKK